VLRILLSPVDETALAWEHAVTGRLAERLPEVLAPARATDGATWFRAGDRVAWLMPWADGDPADPARASDRDTAARALGRIHAAGAELSVTPHPSLPSLDRMPWPDPAIPDPLADHETEIAAERAWGRSASTATRSTATPRGGS